MNLNNLLTLIDKISTSNCSELSYKDESLDIVIKKTITNEETSSSINSSNIIAKKETPLKIKTINAPLVGTFYSAPSKEAENYISIGDEVKKGQILGIIEAMKILTEIESPYDGIVEEILIENTQNIEYDEPLFRIKEI